VCVVLAHIYVHLLISVSHLFLGFTAIPAPSIMLELYHMQNTHIKYAEIICSTNRNGGDINNHTQRKRGNTLEVFLSLEKRI
jgi:hypothetical protein